MYIHIGGEYSIPDRTIIGIFDLDEVTGEESCTSGFLFKAEKDGLVETVSYDLPRSMIVTLERVYISPISASTIKKRAQNKFWVESKINYRKVMK